MKSDIYSIKNSVDPDQLVSEEAENIKKPDIYSIENSVDPDQLASEEAS